ncbi:enhancer of yellow 2b transcription factor [Drosophila ficusphila]|uniref:enhancer of yellow 2b transcription factor n=1 Tax=Drosophila ficusphila TaxID=30025 RepID=UPI0007E6201E|nr:enhancer of yellow 2b transcription factor [Drosophila ficusphila]
MSNSKETGTDSDPLDDVKLNSSDSVALKDLLQKRLSECGWRKDIEELIRQTIKERGVANLTHDELAAEIVPHARALVPEVIRKEMLVRVRAALETSLPPEKN